MIISFILRERVRQRVRQDRTDRNAGRNKLILTVKTSLRSRAAHSLNNRTKKRRQRTIIGCCMTSSRLENSRPRYAPHNLLSFLTQLRPCSENNSFMSRDTREQPPVVGSAKKARWPELCGLNDAGRIPRYIYRASSHGSA